MTLRDRAVGFASLGDTAAEHCRVIRLTDNDLRSWAFFLQHPRHAFERSAGTKTGDPVVESVIGKSRKNLRCRRPGVRVCVGLVLELSHEEPIVFCREFNSLGQHATAFERRRCEYDLGAQEAHHLAALEAEALCHRDDERVAFLSADHRKTDTRIAAGRLDDGLTRFQRTAFLGFFDDTQRKPVFDGAHRIEGLDLDVNVDVFRADLVESDDRRIADRFQNIVESIFHYYCL